MKTRRETVHCPKCNKTVEFEIMRKEMGINESTSPIAEIDNGILSDSGCALRIEAQAKGLNDPKLWINCPTYASHYTG